MVGNPCSKQLSLKYVRLIPHSWGCFQPDLFKKNECKKISERNVFQHEIV